MGVGEVPGYGTPPRGGVMAELALAGFVFMLWGVAVKTMWEGP